MFKVLNGKNPQIVNEVFRIRNEASYEPQQKSRFHIPSVIIPFSGVQKVYSFSVQKSWKLYQMIPNDIKYMPCKSKGFQNRNKKIETNIMPM